MSTPIYSILIISASFFMRELFSKIFTESSKYRILFVKNQNEAVEYLSRESGIDLIILDMESYLESTQESLVKELLAYVPVPIIVITKHGYNIKDLGVIETEHSGIAFLEKPFPSFGVLVLSDFETILFSKIEEVIRHKNDNRRLVMAHKEKESGKVKSAEGAIVIGSSTGGIIPLRRLVANLPPRFPYLIFVVQHLPDAFLKTFISRLNHVSRFEVRQVESGTEVKPGIIWVVSSTSDFHLVTESKPKGHLKINVKLSEKEICNKRLSIIDNVMRATADIFGSRTTGIILSGMGNDGLAGAGQIKAKGGRMIVQDPETAILFGMPQEIIKARLADTVCSVEEISQMLKGISYVN